MALQGQQGLVLLSGGLPEVHRLVGLIAAHPSRTFGFALQFREEEPQVGGGGSGGGSGTAGAGGGTTGVGGGTSTAGRMVLPAPPASSVGSRRGGAETTGSGRSGGQADLDPDPSRDLEGLAICIEDGGAYYVPLHQVWR